MQQKYHPVVSDPVLVTKLFNSTQFAWLWLAVRLYIGYAWVTAGWGKVTGKGWVDGGAALKGYWTNAVRIPETGKPPITYDWYRQFIQVLLEGETYTWFAPLVAWGEVIIGVALILGLLTGFAAFFGAFMNFNFMLAGTTSTNPVLFLGAMLLFLAWKVAGHYGVDRWLLPKVGTPWKSGQGGSARSA